MNLSKKDADLFFELMWSLQFYVNKKLHINLSVNTLEEYIALEQEEKGEVRAQLFEQPDLIDDYLAINPDNLDENKLCIVKKWKSFVKGDFYIERFLKNGTIFIGGEKVYSVIALYDRFDQIIHKSYLPLYTKVILIPFKGKIIYDGLMESYNVSFGEGMKRSLKESYMKAKQNGRIIFSFEETENTRRNKTEVHGKGWSKEIEELVVLANKLKGGANQQVINSPIFSLVKASIQLANKTVILESLDPNEVQKELNKVIKSVNKIESIINRMD